MDNDGPCDRLSGVSVGLHNRLTDIAAMPQTPAAQEISARAVNAADQVITTSSTTAILMRIFGDAGDHLTRREANVGRRIAKVLAPITQQHKQFASFSDTSRVIAGVDPLGVRWAGRFSRRSRDVKTAHMCRWQTVSAATGRWRRWRGEAMNP